MSEEPSYWINPSGSFGCDIGDKARMRQHEALSKLERIMNADREIEQLRAERDALRARIEGAPVVKVRGRAGELAAFYVSHSLIGKRVALVPLDD